MNKSKACVAVSPLVPIPHVSTLSICFLAFFLLWPPMGGTAKANEAPSGEDNTVTLLEDTPYPFSVGDFGFTDADQPAHALAGVKITTLPGAGGLQSEGLAVTNGQRIALHYAGAEWTARAVSDYWTSVAMSTDGTKLVAAVWDGSIYTSTDAGTNWTARATNLEWTSVASSADGTKLVAVGD